MKINNRLKLIVSNRKIIVVIYLLLAMAASFQSLSRGKKTFNNSTIEYNQYNNYTIFENSFNHLKEGKDLYIAYPDEHWDLYKYSPTFAVFFGAFAVFPDWIGLNLWNMLNAMVLLLAVYSLPKINNYQKGLILLISLIELMTSMQNEQSNALIAGLIILAFGQMERDKYFLATLLIVVTVFVKLFGIVGFALFLFYPKKWKIALYSILWLISLFAIPLIFIDLEQYKALIVSYWHMLSNDQSASEGFSVMGWLYSWFGFEINKLIIVIVGAIIFLIPFYRIKEYKNYTFKFLALTSILIWVVIFNHKAESPTFIIAMAGVSLWFITTEKNKLNSFLFVSAFILTSLSPTDIFPRFIRVEYVTPFALKVFPCILIWAKIIYDMLVLKKDRISEVSLSKIPELTELNK